MVIDENKRRRERKEFMHPRYAHVRIFALVRKNKGFMTVCQTAGDGSAACECVSGREE